ncbi:glycosyltransferase [Fusobacterium pseudoperiodonticum]|uniref:glycosyltransferase n=1 Tax=Fusobacterium pseudoperiodonticum TaxID=2663009 RepID=UPI0028EABC9E|nr:glycosyltransferase [Fusobacterium pseudoperiodonticum]
MDIRVKDIIKDNSIWLPSQDYNEKKKLSILMPTFGRGKDGFLKRAVTSYIEQTFKDTELIIIDDANTDGTSEQIDEFMRQDKRISCIRHKQNMGLPAISLYEAIKKARGEYIGFLFDNCVLYPSAYERSLRRMEEEGAQASYGRVTVYTDKDDISKSKEFYCREEYLDNLEITNSIGNVAIVFKKDILETIGYFDPHVCLTRLADWDFITRVKRKFHLIETGVLFASEYGITQSNSLGNSYLINSLAINEYLKIPNREKRLFLNDYEEINIFSEEENSSYNFSSEIKKSLDFFKNKYWLSAFKNIKERKNVFDDNVAILCSGPITSSISLLFSRNCSDFAQNMFSYINDDKNIAKSRAAILVRETNMNSSLLKKLEYAGIPTYLLWDDDFLLLSKEKILNLNITENDFKKVAKQLNGLIFTSKNFCQNYEEKGYNPNNYLVNPVYLDELEKEISLIQDSQLNIAFTGGLWRIKKFISVLVDILNNIGKEKKVTLYLLKDKELANIFDEKRINFTVKWYDITLSYDQLINKLSNKNIHIVIHPSQEIENNVNKTKNALVTASLLGASLITTDGAPYNVKDSEDDPMPYLLASNEEKYWVEAINKMLDNSVRIEMVKKARDYCKKRYSARCLDKLIEDVLKDTPKVDINLYSERLEKLAYFSGKMQRSGNFNQTMVDGIGEDIIATKKIDKKLKTFFVANKNNFSTISIIFGTHQRSPQGTCKIKVFDEKNTKIHDGIISLDEVSDNKFYNINLEYIENTMGKKFYISFEFSYINENKVSVYERNYKYSNNKIIRNLIRPFRKNEIYVSLS